MTTKMQSRIDTKNREQACIRPVKTSRIDIGFTLQERTHTINQSTYEINCLLGLMHFFSSLF